MSIVATSPFLSSLEHIMGFLVVLFALCLLWGLTAIIGKVFIRMGTEAVVTVPATPAEEGPAEEEVVAITAVVAALLGRRSRIVSIRSGGARDWNREGRREHFASHRIR